MAKSDQKKSAFSGLSELRGRLLFLLGAILVYRLGTHVPVPGVDPAALAQLFAQTRGSIVDIFNMFSGGALSRLSVFALGIMPYISASIIMQMLSTIVPTLEQMKKEGEAGRRKIAQYTRYGTLVLASFQAFGITVLLESQQVGGQSILLSTGLSFKITAVVTLVAGTMFLVWLGEQITQRGIGNGISLIIFAGIVAGLPNAIRGVLDLASTGVFSSVGVMLLLVGAILITYFVVFVERGQRRIVVNYAQRQQGRQMMNAQSSHLPLKINMAGVIPPIFASSLILFPATISTWLSNSDSMRWLGNISTLLAPGQPLYTLIYALLIIFFCFFYTALTFNPMDMADNLKKSGAFIPGVRPGVQTSKYIDTVVSRLTLVGAIYLTFVCLIPEFLIVKWNVPFYFGGTSLLIIVVVIMDLITQIQSHLMSRQYDSLMKKSSLSRGPGGAR